MKDEFGTNLLRLISAHMHFQSVLLASREMFGRGYFSLGLGEKLAVDQAVLGNVVPLYQGITAEALAAQVAQGGAGFLNQAAKQSGGSS